MEVKKAFEILGLHESATESEIEASFRSLALARHPDRGGSDAEMQELNTARSVANSVARNTAIIPISVVKDIVAATTNALTIRSEISRDIGVAVSQIKEKATGQLKQSRQMATLVGGVSAAALFLGKDLPEAFLGSLAGPDMSAVFSIAFLFVGMIAAVMYWKITNEIDQMERSTDEFSAYLSSRPNYALFMDHVTQGSDNWTHDELAEYLERRSFAGVLKERNWARLAYQIGSDVLARLLVSKGLELDLLKREEITDGRRLIERYSLALKNTGR